METLIQDVRYAVRTLLRVPGFSMAAVLTLGLGIGATTMIFSMVNGILLRPFPFAEPDRIVAVSEHDLEEGVTDLVTSYPTFLDWRAQSRTLAAIAAFDDQTLTARFGDDAERFYGAHVSADVFTVLGVAPVRGRGLREADDRPGAAPVVIISHRLWQERFGAAEDVIGRTLSVNSEPHEIVAVMPPGFAFPERSELWVALGRIASQERGRHHLAVIGRLRDDATLAQAAVEFGAISDRLAQTYEQNEGYRADVTPLREATTREIRPVMLVLLGAVGFVLLIACANVANLMLARAVAREREVAIRTALGAARGRILRQLLTESAVIAAAGGVLGLLFSMWWLDLIIASIPAQLPYWLRFGIDGRVLAFSSAIALGSALLFGFAPALQAVRVDQHTALKDGGRGASAGARARLRGAFVVAQLAASIVLLVGGLLMVRSFLAMRRVDPGFRTSGIITMNIALPPAQYPADVNVNGFYDELLDRLRARPDITTAELINNFPISGMNVTGNFSIDGVGEVVGVSAHNHAVSPGYFDAMDIAIERGRAFEPGDVAGAQNVAIINRALADRYFPGEDPIGRGIRFGGGTDGDFYRIVGVAANANQRDVNQTAAEPSLYRPFAQSPVHNAALVVRPRSEAVAAVTGAIRDETRALDPDIPVYDVRTVQQVLTEAVWDARLFTTLFGVFAAAALLLAAIGLHGVVAYGVAQRRREIGVRMALGANTRDVVRLVVRQSMRLTAVGLAIGMVLAFAASRAMASLLFGVSSRDPLTFLAVPLLLALVALSASWSPARRAARVEAMTALRAD